MIIPKLHYSSQGNSPKEHLENIQNACTSGAELVQLNLRSVSEKKYLKFAEAAREITSHFQTRLILTDHYKLAKTVKADGVYSIQSGSSPATIRKILYSWQSIGATAHTLQDCETLINSEVDYIGLGPYAGDDYVAAALGINGYKAITDVLKTNTVILAYGNIMTADVPSLLNSGVSGIMLSTEISDNFNLIRKYNQLLSASAVAEQKHTFK